MVLVCGGTGCFLAVDDRDGCEIARGLGGIFRCYRFLEMVSVFGYWLLPCYCRPSRSRRSEGLGEKVDSPNKEFRFIRNIKFKISSIPYCRTAFEARCIALIPSSFDDIFDEVFEDDVFAGFDVFGNQVRGKR